MGDATATAHIVPRIMAIATEDGITVMGINTAANLAAIKATVDYKYTCAE